MTPYEIGIAMHYHTRAGEYKDGALICDDTILHFVSFGLLAMLSEPDRYGALHVATPRLHAYCDALCDVPLPISKWVIPEKGE